MDTKQHSSKAGWRPSEWARDAGVSRSFTYELLDAGHLKSVKAGSARIITTTPAEYLAELAAKQANSQAA